MIKQMVAGIVMITSVVALAQSSGEDKWGTFRSLIGRWAGHTDGLNGTSEIATEFALIFNEQYLRISNRSVFPPQEKNPDGETHEDVGYISFDTKREKYVLREFNIEGYVNQYVLDSATTGGRLLFESESLENAPTGMKAMLVYERLGTDTLLSWFHLAFPGKDYSCFSTGVAARHE